jgi:hypothetical protein
MEIVNFGEAKTMHGYGILQKIQRHYYHRAWQAGWKTLHTGYANYGG